MQMRNVDPLDGVTLGFVGAGNMAEALIRGLLRNTSISPGSILVNNRGNAARLVGLKDRYGIVPEESKDVLCVRADLLILAVKPADIDVCTAQLEPYVRRDHLILSVLAGVRLAALAARLPRGRRIVRAMPNTSATVGAGITAITYPSDTDEDTRALVDSIFAAVGEVVSVAEDMIDVVTGLSGSGPAYIYLVAEALAEAGRKLGLSREIALRLAIETIAGAGAMMKSGVEPSSLRRQVTSAGGTTEAGLAILQDRGLSAMMEAAVDSASKRSRELADLCRTERSEVNTAGSLY